MRFRYLLLIFVVVFAATLAVIVGEQLSSEAMSVMVGVVAGVGASIPTSLLIMWFAVRTAELRAVPEMPAPMAYPMEAPEPRIVVVTQRTERPALPEQPRYAAVYDSYAPHSYEVEPEAPSQPSPALLPPPRQRRFTVVGGTDGLIVSEPQYQEVVWQR
jgi:hypothetical protein